MGFFVSLISLPLVIALFVGLWFRHRQHWDYLIGLYAANLFRRTPYVRPAERFVEMRGLYAQLHTGAIDASGMTNVANNSVRRSVAFNPSSGGKAVSMSDGVWRNVSGSETYTNVTLWDAPASGNFLCQAPIHANPVSAGDTFVIARGCLSINESSRLIAAQEALLGNVAQ